MIKSPIQEVTNKLQYRAIGIIYGFYKPLETVSLNKGLIIDKNSLELDTVVLGKVLPLIRKYVDLQKQYYWIVYPRNKNSGNIHLQIAGIWDPCELNGFSKKPLQKNNDLLSEFNLKDNFFSIRGKLIFINESQKEIIIKICQSNSINKTRYKSFKIVIKGEIPMKFLNSFVSLVTYRNNNSLCLDTFDVIETNF